MKKPISIQWPIAITILGMVIATICEQYWLQVPAVMTVGVIWFLYSRDLADQLLEKDSFVKRVILLQKFSMELQEVINTELLMAQEDIMRIRSVVSDSIAVLQENVQLISEQSNNQYKTIQNAFGDKGSERSLQNPEDVVEVISKLSNNMMKVSKAVAEVEGIASQANLIGDSLMVEMAKVGNQAQSLASSAHQVKSFANNMSVSSSEIHQDAERLKHVLNSIRDIQNGYCHSAGFYSSQPMVEQQINEGNYAIETSTNNIMRALQFEDIVGQISERVVDHIGDIRSAVDIFSHLCESELSDNFEDEIAQMRAQLEVIKDKLKKASAKSVVAQENMDEGDIELF